MGEVLCQPEPETSLPHSDRNQGGRGTQEGGRRVHNPFNPAPLGTGTAMSTEGLKSGLQ